MTLLTKINTIGYGKWLYGFILPAVATFVGSVGVVWGVPYTDKVVLTISALNVLVGAAFMIDDKVTTGEIPVVAGPPGPQGPQGSPGLHLDIDEYEELQARISAVETFLKE